jgi:hypothetical protein
MKKITLMVAAVLVAATSWAQNPTVSKVWEFSAAATSDAGGRPTYIGSADKCRGLAFGTVGSEKILVVPTREPANAVHVIDATSGIVLRQLNISTLTGGTYLLNDAGITTDGKILVGNLALGTAGSFKVYKWEDAQSTTVPTVAISFPINSDASRFGDHFIVTGSMSNGTAKVYAASAAKVTLNTVANVQKILCWSMIPDTNNPGSYIFDQANPAVLSASIINTGNAFSAPSVCPLPNGKYIFKGNGSNMVMLNSDGTLEGTSSLSTIVPTGGNGVKYIKTITGENGAADTTYVAYFRYGSGFERADIFKMPNNTFAGSAWSTMTNSLGANGNTNGVGRVCVENNQDGSANLYVLGTNNGIGKYSVVWPSTPTSINTTKQSLKITKTSSLLKVEGVAPTSIELFNTMGQKVQSVINRNELNISNLRGVHIVKVNVNGQVSTQKINL